MLPDAGPAGYTLIFDDEFDTLSLEPNSDCFGSVAMVCDGGGTWLPLYTWNNRTLSGNDEAEIYIDPTYAGSGAGCTTALGINPLLIDAGILTLQANPTPAADLACLSSLPYTSGAIISYPSFATTYGYFEARIRMPAGQGLWPAFWLLDENLQWPPEIDILEFVDVDGGQPSTLQMHTHDSNTTYAYGAATQVPNVSWDFHVYAVDWEPDTITWYFDGVQQAQTTTAPDLNQPMYILLNLAVGGTGSWPGPPDTSTTFRPTCRSTTCGSGRSREGPSSRHHAAAFEQGREGEPLLGTARPIGPLVREQRSQVRRSRWPKSPGDSALHAQERGFEGIEGGRSSVSGLVSEQVRGRARPNPFGVQGLNLRQRGHAETHCSWAIGTECRRERWSERLPLGDVVDVVRLGVGPVPHPRQERGCAIGPPFAPTPCSTGSPRFDARRRCRAPARGSRGPRRRAARRGSSRPRRRCRSDPRRSRRPSLASGTGR